MASKKSKGGFKAANIQSISFNNSPKIKKGNVGPKKGNAFAKGDATPAGGK